MYYFGVKQDTDLIMAFIGQCFALTRVALS